MAEMIYKVNDKPRFKELIVYALQQLLAIIAGTIAVPALIGLPEMMPAAIFGAGLGTLTYLLITKRKSPVILSSNFAFIGALAMASQNYGFLGILLGGLFTGSVYITLSIIIRCVGTKWIDKLLPPIIIGPVVSLIGLTLAGNAMNDLVTANGYITTTGAHPYNLIALLCGLITFFTVIICSSQNRNKFLNMTPFIVGIGVLFWLYRPIHDELDGKFYLDNKYYGSDKFIKVSSSELAKVRNKSYVLFTYNNYCTFPISCESIFQEFMSKYNISFLSIPFEDFKETYLYDKLHFVILSMHLRTLR